MLSFTMLGIFWYRHNRHYHQFQMITRSMLMLRLIQLAASAFFPFCAALFGRYPTNQLALAIYTGCVLVYLWCTLITWVVAKRSGCLAAGVTEEDYRKTRRKTLRGCLLVSTLFCFYVIQALQ